MIKGFYSAVSAMLVNANRQQLLAHNIANLETPGFKQILTTVEDFMATPVVSPAGDILHTNRQSYVGMLGLGAENGPEMVDFTAGGMRTTGNLYDLAVRGEGFFRVQTADGERYTRDGRFKRDPQGNLVTFQGFAVLDENGQPITLPEGELEVAPDGTLTVSGEEAGRLGLALFADPEAALQRTEGNLYTAAGQPDGEGEVQVVQGFLEMSNANPTQIMAQLVEVARAYEAAQQLVQNQDELLGKSISILGRIG